MKLLVMSENNLCSSEVYIYLINFVAVFKLNNEKQTKES